MLNIFLDKNAKSRHLKTQQYNQIMDGYRWALAELFLNYKDDLNGRVRLNSFLNMRQASGTTDYFTNGVHKAIDDFEEFVAYVLSIKNENEKS